MTFVHVCRFDLQGPRRADDLEFITKSCEISFQSQPELAPVSCKCHVDGAVPVHGPPNTLVAAMDLFVVVGQGLVVRDVFVKSEG